MRPRPRALARRRWTSWGTGPLTARLTGAFGPLLFWVSTGLVLYRWLPESVVRGLGRFLYWIGIPLEIYALSRHARFTWQVGLGPIAAIAAVVTGAVLMGILWGLLCWRSPRQPTSPDPTTASESTALDSNIAEVSEHSTESWWWRSPSVGSAAIASMLGNTGFVGLALTPHLLDPGWMALPVFYNLTQNVLGTYGLGVLVASTFGNHGGDPERDRPWWQPLRDVVTVPSIWAFVLGTATQPIPFSPWVEQALDAWVPLTIAIAFVLMGLRLSQLRDWRQLKPAIAPAFIKIFLVPLLAGLVATAAGLDGQLRLAIVLMAGMPTAFAGLILAEEYDLDRPMISASIALSTLAILGTMPLWLWIWG